MTYKPETDYYALTIDDSFMPKLRGEDKDDKYKFLLVLRTVLKVGFMGTQAQLKAHITNMTGVEMSQPQFSRYLHKFGVVVEYGQSVYENKWRWREDYLRDGEAI